MTSRNRLKGFILPPCWNDDVRMNMLFTSFRNQAVNPAGWQDKMNFWINVITNYCHQTKCVIFTHEDLCLTFERNGSAPQCLRIVLDSMLNEGSIMPVTDFSRMPSQKQSWLNWGYDILLCKPFTWGLSTFQSALHWNQKDNRYVLLSLIKNFACKIFLRHKELMNSQWTDNVMFVETLEEQCKDICTGLGFQMALTQLAKDNEGLVFDMNGQWVIKFRGDEETIAPLSDLDQGILRLQKARDIIQKEVDKADSEINSCTQEAKQFVREGLKTKAMICLKKKKRLENHLQKKVDTLDNVEHLLCQLRNSTSQKMVLRAYNAGVLAMKCAVKGGLDLDSIDTTMADVEEMLDLANELQDIISKPTPAVEQELAGLEEELEELLATDKNADGTTGRPAAAQEGASASLPDAYFSKLIVNLPPPPSSPSTSKDRRKVPVMSQPSM